ncbi:MAG TPA: DUF488 family protein [Methanoregulaceae archaeon]|nr:DUF488 family protein [Methanoregulaceae archaeon]
MVIIVKRIYDHPAAEDGYRVLVERLWPRGMSKENAHIDLWLREAGASPSLRRWFGHDPGKWETFRQRYFMELHDRPWVVQQLREIIKREGKVTFVFSAHDERYNNAIALKQFLETGQIQELAAR